MCVACLRPSMPLPAKKSLECVAHIRSFKSSGTTRDVRLRLMRVISFRSYSRDRPHVDSAMDAAASGLFILELLRVSLCQSKPQRSHLRVSVTLFFSGNLVLSFLLRRKRLLFYTLTDIMTTSKRCLAFVAGAALTLGLLLLASQLWHFNNNSWIAIFDGELPPVPEYGPDDEVKELLYTDTRRPGTGLDTAPLDYATEENLSAAATPSTTRMADWDPIWDDPSKWPSWSTPGPTPTSSSVSSLRTDNNPEADLEDYAQ